MPLTEPSGGRDHRALCHGRPDQLPLDRQSFVSISWSQALATGGFVGGATGSLLAVIFPAVDRWEIRSARIVRGAALGRCLGFWNLDDFEGLLFFFTIWQGGLATDLSLAGEWGRNRRDWGFFRPFPDREGVFSALARVAG